VAHDLLPVQAAHLRYDTDLAAASTAWITDRSATGHSCCSTNNTSTCHNTQKTASAHAFVFLFFVFFHFIHLKNKSNEKVLLKIE
jgi:hypothetical protein